MKLNHLFLLFLLVCVCLSCEEEFLPDEITVEPMIVVEGYVEAAENPEDAAPPYVLLTRNLPFFTELDSNQFGDFYVHDALVTIDNGDQLSTLTEICLNDLTPEQRVIAEAFLGTNLELVSVSFCVYIDLDFTFTGEAGKTYDLRIETEDEILTATTTIPIHVPLDSIWFADPPGENTRDSLAQMQVKLTDPPGPSFYRYFADVNRTGFRRDDFSVLDDPFFDGEEIVFPLNKPAVDSVEFDLSTFGLFTRGDEVNLKWITFEKDVFDFWNTIEFAAANQGPFSNATIIDSNVEGGLGVWSGQSASYYDLVVPDR